MATSMIHKERPQDGMQDYLIALGESVTINLSYRSLYLVGFSGNAARGVLLINTVNNGNYITELTPGTSMSGFTYSASGLVLTLTNVSTYSITAHVVPIWLTVNG